VRDVHAGRPDADDEGRGDLGVGVATGDEGQNLRLPRRQAEELPQALPSVRRRELQPRALGEQEPWPTEDLMVEGMLRNIEAGETFIVWDDDGTPAATITINTWAKPELWTEQERAEPPLYAHKITVDRAYGGQGLGAELLDWAGTRAADKGTDWLRVDVWTTSERLQHHYLKQGFTYVRTVVLPHNPSGALFQRPAQRASQRHACRRSRA
jgi:GNAT superfamily N-acetyltransferase